MSSTQYLALTYMGKGSKKEWVYVYVSLTHFAAHLKLTQCGKSTILPIQFFFIYLNQELVLQAKIRQARLFLQERISPLIFQVSRGCQYSLACGHISPPLLLSLSYLVT